MHRRELAWNILSGIFSWALKARPTPKPIMQQGEVVGLRRPLFSIQRRSYFRLSHNMGQNICQLMHVLGIRAK